MKTLFVVDVETGCVVGFTSIEDDTVSISFTETEEYEGGAISTNIDMPVQMVEIGPAIGLVIVAPNEAVAYNIIDALDKDNEEEN